MLRPRLPKIENETDVSAGKEPEAYRQKSVAADEAQANRDRKESRRIDIATVKVIFNNPKRHQVFRSIFYEATCLSHIKAG